MMALMAANGSPKIWFYDLAGGVLLYSSEINHLSGTRVQDEQGNVHSEGGSAT